MAEHTAIARPYAQAAFELAQSAGQLGPWSDALQAAAAVVGDEQVAVLIGSPATDRGKLVSLISDIAASAADGVPTDKLTNLIHLLTDNGRLAALPDIARAFDALKAETENRVEVTLTAASPVDDAQQSRIIEALQKRFGREVSLSFELDESLIGGARLRADDLVIDGSVKTGLAKLASALAN